MVLKWGSSRALAMSALEYRILSFLGWMAEGLTYFFTRSIFTPSMELTPKSVYQVTPSIFTF